MEITINEIKILENEIFGIPAMKDENGKEVEAFKGILQQNLSFKGRYWINTHLVPKLESANKVIREKVIEFGKESGCEISISPMDNKSEYVDQEKSSDEAKKLFNEKVINFANTEKLNIDFSIPLEYLEGLSSTMNYVLMKFIKE